MWRWNTLSVRAHAHKYLCTLGDNTQCVCVHTVCCPQVYIGICARVRARLMSSNAHIILDNNSSVSFLFSFKQSAGVRISIGLGSNLRASFCGRVLRLELLADKAAKVNITFANVLSESDVKVLLKLRASARALICVAVITANLKCANVINAFALGKFVRLKVVYDVMQMAHASLAISPKLMIRDMLSSFAHAVNVNCLSCCSYCDNRLINAPALSALSAYSLCTTLFD